MMNSAVQTGQDVEEQEAADMASTDMASAITRPNAIDSKNEAVLEEAQEDLWLYYNPSRAKTCSR